MHFLALLASFFLTLHAIPSFASPVPLHGDPSSLLGKPYVVRSDNGDFHILPIAERNDGMLRRADRFISMRKQKSEGEKEKEFLSYSGPPSADSSDQTSPSSNPSSASVQPTAMTISQAPPVQSSSTPHPALHAAQNKKGGKKNGKKSKSKSKAGKSKSTASHKQ